MKVLRKLFKNFWFRIIIINTIWLVSFRYFQSRKYADIQNKFYNENLTGILDSIPDDQPMGAIEFYLKDDSNKYSLIRPYPIELKIRGKVNYIEFLYFAKSRKVNQIDSLFKPAGSDSITIHRNGVKYSWLLDPPDKLIY